MPDVMVDGRVLPPMTPRVRRDLDALSLRVLLAAYYTPLITSACGPRHPDRHFRLGADTLLVVTDAGKVISMQPRGTADRPVEGAEPSRRPAGRRPARHRRRGGIGTRIPTSLDELLAALKRLGATACREGRHLCVTAPDGRMVVLPRTPSDWRTLANCVTKLRQFGLDVRRP